MLNAQEDETLSSALHDGLDAMHLKGHTIRRPYGNLAVGW